MTRQCNERTRRPTDEIFELENHSYNVWVYIVSYKAVAEGQKQRAWERY